jgi:hypothetical protein
MQFFSEQFKRFSICGDNLPWISLHQENWRID